MKAATMQRTASTTTGAAAGARPVLREIMNRMPQQQGQQPPGPGMRKAPTQQREDRYMNMILTAAKHTCQWMTKCLLEMEWELWCHVCPKN